MEKPKLSDILRRKAGDGLAAKWKEAAAAKEFTPLPAGIHDMKIVRGEAHQSRNKGTPSYKITFEVIGGEHVGQKVWYDIWLTERALPQAKRDLQKIGVPIDDYDAMLAHLDKPIPEGIRCKVTVTVTKEDDGREYNKVRSFAVVGIEEPPPNPFPPQTEMKAEAPPAVMPTEDIVPPVIAKRRGRPPKVKAEANGFAHKEGD